MSFAFHACDLGRGLCCIDCGRRQVDPNESKAIRINISEMRHNNTSASYYIEGANRYSSRTVPFGRSTRKADAETETIGVEIDASTDRVEPILFPSQRTCGTVQVVFVCCLVQPNTTLWNSTIFTTKLVAVRISIREYSKLYHRRASSLVHPSSSYHHAGQVTERWKNNLTKSWCHSDLCSFCTSCTSANRDSPMKRYISIHAGLHKNMGGIYRSLLWARRQRR